MGLSPSSSRKLREAEKVRSSFRGVRERCREEAALRKRREEAIRAHKERFRPTVMVVDRASMSGRYIERQTDEGQALARARAINAGGSDDVAFVVHANIDGGAPLKPESMYSLLKERGLI
jgi:hypothetical protein